MLFTFHMSFGALPQPLRDEYPIVLGIRVGRPFYYVRDVVIIYYMLRKVRNQLDTLSFPPVISH